jgi:hypothetical protein
MESERDTHFAGFAKLLTQELWEQGYLRGKPHVFEEIIRPYIETLIARRVYDLLVYDRMNTGTSDLQHAASSLEAAEMVNGIPDLTAWPKEQTHGH